MFETIKVTGEKWFKDHQEKTNLIFDKDRKGRWYVSRYILWLGLDGKTIRDITPKEDLKPIEVSENICCLMLGKFATDHEGIIKGIYRKDGIEMEFSANLRGLI